MSRVKSLSSLCYFFCAFLPHLNGTRVISCKSINCPGKTCRKARRAFSTRNKSYLADRRPKKGLGSLSSFRSPVSGGGARVGGTGEWLLSSPGFQPSPLHPCAGFKGTELQEYALLLDQQVSREMLPCKGGKVTRGCISVTE